MRRLFLRAGLASFLFLTHCLSADARLYACDSQGACPDGFVCAQDLLCHLLKADAGTCRALGMSGCSVDADCCSSLSCHAERCESANDTCPYATVFNFAFDGGTLGEAYGTTVGSLNDEAACSSQSGDVYYKFSAEGALRVEVTQLFDAGFEPMVSLVGKCGSTVSSCGAGTEGAASFSVTGLAPRVWHVVVDGRTAASGAFKLKIGGSNTNLATGDVCGDEQALVVGPPAFSTRLGPFDTTQMVRAADSADPCVGNFRDRVYRLEAMRGGTLQVTLTAAWDLALALSKGPDCERATAVVGCVDLAAAGGTESLSTQVPDGGGVYYLWVSGNLSTDFGSYSGLATLQ